MPKNTCRYYERRFPEVEDVVMVNVRSIAEMGAYVSLLEYDGIGGMILLSELSRRRIRSINKLIRVGRQECVVVLRVDTEKGYIDLSKRRVSAEEIAKCEDRYNKGKAVNQILRHVSETVGCDMEELYKKTAWHFDTKFGSSYDAFKLSITDPDSVFEGVDLPQKTKDLLLLDIRKRLTPQPTKIRADIEVCCYKYEGVDAVRDSLRAGLQMSTDVVPIKINLVAPPLYVVSTNSLDKEKGVERLNEAIAVIKAEITKKGGSLVVQNAPRAISEHEERELTDMLLELERQNAEVGGDEDGSDDEDAPAAAEE